MKIIINQTNSGFFKKYVASMLYLIIYSLTLLYFFKEWLFYNFGYSAMSWNYNVENIAACLLYAIIIVFIVSLNPDNVKTLFLWFLILLVLIPMTILHCYTKYFSNFGTFVFYCHFTVIIIAMLCLFEVEIIKNKPKVFNEKSIILIMFLITVFTISRYLYLNGIGAFNLNITKVYDYRLNLRITMKGILAYLDVWVMMIINPFCIIWSLYNKKKLLICVFIFMQILLFGFNSQKTTLFSILLIIILYYAIPILLKNQNNIIILFIGFHIIPLFLVYNRISGYWAHLYNREIFVPSKNILYYYDYFSKNSFDWFASSFLRHIVDSKYEYPLPRIIGYEYYGNIESNINVSFLGGGYSHGGLVVMIFYAFVISYIISFIASSVKIISPKIVIPLSMLPILSLFTSTDLPGALLTGGILLLLILLYNFPRFQDSKLK